MANNKNSTLPDIGDNTTEVSNNFIEAMGAEPCALALVAIMIIVYFIIRGNNKHQEKMEEIRMKQFREIKGVNDGN